MTEKNGYAQVITQQWVSESGPMTREELEAFLNRKCVLYTEKGCIPRDSYEQRVKEEGRRVLYKVTTLLPAVSLDGLPIEEY